MIEILVRTPASGRRILAAGMPRDVLVNINFPDCAPDEVKGIAITMQGKRDQDLLRVDARHDGRGNPYYWLAFARRERRNLGVGTDLAAIAENRIAVTPLRLNLTDEPFMTRLAEELDEASRRSTRTSPYCVMPFTRSSPTARVSSWWDRPAPTRVVRV